jgi:hypothetical protein
MEDGVLAVGFVWMDGVYLAFLDLWYMGFCILRTDTLSACSSPRQDGGFFFVRGKAEGWG